MIMRTDPKQTHNLQTRPQVLGNTAELELVDGYQTVGPLKMGGYAEAHDYQGLSGAY